MNDIPLPALSHFTSRRRDFKLLIVCASTLPLLFSIHSHPVFMKEMQNAKTFMVFILHLLSLAFKRNHCVECDCSKGIQQHKVPLI